MKITDRVATEIASHEALVRQAYKDGVGVWTWGIGITNASGHDVKRYIDNPQSYTKVMAVFCWALENYADDVRRVFRGFELSEAQFAAALSFHYNTGGIGYASWVKHFKNGDIAKAKKAFMNWRKPNSIIPRRQKERDLFFDGKWSNKGTIPEYTKVSKNHTPVWSSRKDIDARQCFAPNSSSSAREFLDNLSPTPVHTPREPDVDFSLNGEITPKNQNALLRLFEAAFAAFSNLLKGGKS